MKAKKPEILAPAGSLAIMKQAFQAGADAVYLGGRQFGARAYAANLTEEELLQGIEYVQLHNRRLYLTVNTLLKNEEIDRLLAFLRKPYEAGLDAVIVQDLGVAQVIHSCFPDLELHASTQMSITGPYGADLLKELGASRIVPARELSLAELQSLRSRTDLELEVFVHGALCYSYSGHCLLSSMIGGRSGNRGRCAQPCRQLYRSSGREPAYLLSPRDLCGLGSVPELIQTGVDSFKIEGRMKKPEYVIAAVNAYRKAVDAYFERQDISLTEERERLADVFNRGNFTEGYFHRHNGPDMMAMERNHHNGILLGTVRTVKGNQIIVDLNRDLHHGDVLEIRTASGEEIELTAGQEGTAGDSVTLNGRRIKQIQPGNPVYRTKNHWLCRQLTEENDENRLKEKINFSVTLKKDLSATIKADCNGQSVVVSGSRVTLAQNHPLSKEVILEKLQKLGDSPFVPGNIQVDMEEDCFYSMKEWNQLRRQAVAQLEQVCSSVRKRQPLSLPEALTEPLQDWEESGREGSSNKVLSHEDSSREGALQEASTQKSTFQEGALQEVSTRKGAFQEGAFHQEEGRNTMPPILAVGVSTEEQLEAALQTESVSRIDMEMETFSLEEIREGLTRIRNAGKQGYLSLPRMFRMDMEPELISCLKAGAEGYVVRTLDELAFLRIHAPEAFIVCDYSVYAYNKAAAAVYGQLGRKLTLTLPVEFHQQDLLQLRESTRGYSWEWIIYGAQPVMISAQCIAKNMGDCRNESGSLTFCNGFQDEYRAHKICKYCYNVIYQTRPVCLISAMEEQNPGIDVYRIMLTTESGAELRRILELHPEETYSIQSLERDYKHYYFIIRGIE